MPLLVGVSGVIGSGKDYLTEALRKEMTSRGRTTEQSSFAKPLKNELTDIIKLIKSNRNKGNKLAGFIADKKDMTVEQAKLLVDTLSPDLNTSNVNGWSRTLGVRSSLQILGTDIRRAQNPNYWTDLLLKEANSMDTDFVFVSDGRFPNEMDFFIEHGGVTFRLDVPENVLEQRRMSRDGITYTPEQLNHESETALNDYDKFDYLVGEVVEPEFLGEILDMRFRLR